MTVEQDNEVARAKRLSLLRDQARLFREVFTTASGAAVFHALTVNFKTASGFPPNQLDDGGRTDALQTWRKLGHFDVMAFIKTQMEWKEIEHEHPSRTSYSGSSADPGSSADIGGESAVL